MSNKDAEHVQIGVADGLDRVDRRSAREDRERCEQLTLGEVEQIVRPGDRRTKRLLARVDIAAALQPVEATAEPRQDLGRCEKTRPRSSKLDRERKVIEPRAELRNRADLTRVEPHRGGPRPEQLDRLRCRQRRHRVHVLARELETLSARDYDRRLARISK